MGSQSQNGRRGCTMNNFCLVCQKPLTISGKRGRGLLLATCCDLRYTLSMFCELYRAEKRFSSANVVWHMTHRLDDYNGSAYEDTTTFVAVERKNKSKQITQRKEYNLSGLVLPERFINLLSFL